MIAPFFGKTVISEGLRVNNEQRYPGADEWDDAVFKAGYRKYSHTIRPNANTDSHQLSIRCNMASKETSKTHTLWPLGRIFDAINLQDSCGLLLASSLAFITSYTTLLLAVSSRFVSFLHAFLPTSSWNKLPEKVSIVLHQLKMRLN